MHPLVSAILMVGAGGGYKKTTIAVTVAGWNTGKDPRGIGWDEVGNVTDGSPRGSVSSDQLGGQTLETIGLYNVDATGPNDEFIVYMQGTGYSKNDIVSVLVDDDGGTDLMVVDANVSWGESGGPNYTYWIWNSTDHTLPTWTGTNTYDCEFLHKAVI